MHTRLKTKPTKSYGTTPLGISSLAPLVIQPPAPVSTLPEHVRTDPLHISQVLPHVVAAILARCDRREARDRRRGLCE